MKIILRNNNIEELSNQYLMYVIIINSQDNFVFPITKSNKLNIPVQGQAEIELDFNKVISVAKYKTIAGQICINSNYLLPKAEYTIVRKDKVLEFSEANHVDNLKDNEISIVNQTDINLELSFKINDYYTFASLNCPLMPKQTTTIELRKSLFLSIGNTDYIDINALIDNMRNDYTTWEKIDLKNEKNLEICCELVDNKPVFNECKES
ncbi:hypothetical protein C8E03_11131 [Lachnotalea glycerini]|uniref:Uncharacterized protein n=1 Tax=Lachnotalea glycerini TaxID=1763509 RepID=A0A318EK91_9FIRM|nr:hypothetical protein [Lachnotalea glycerini]OYP24565.1 hypothetical protein CG709_07390 [Lachnotalea glycerini]PXV86831.1 hypothetical protein C8E03_11131 [Lachnotalea glycerini]